MSYFKAKMHQIRLRLGSAPDPAGRAYSAPPGPLAGFKDLLLRERVGKEGKSEGREGRGGEEKRTEEGPYRLHFYATLSTGYSYCKHQTAAKKFAGFCPRSHPPPSARGETIRPYVSREMQRFVYLRFYSFLPARRYASAVFATATCLSVCPSVRHTPVLCENGAF